MEAAAQAISTAALERLLEHVRRDTAALLFHCLLGNLGSHFEACKTGKGDAGISEWLCSCIMPEVAEHVQLQVPSLCMQLKRLTLSACCRGTSRQGCQCRSCAGPGSGPPWGHQD